MHSSLDNSASHGRGAKRPRLLITAYHYDRAFSMESRLSWQRAQHAAREYEVTVICARGDAAEQGGAANGGVQSVVLPFDRVERALTSWGPSYYLGYRRWHRRVFGLAARLHREQPFDLVHHVSFCGYREPSDCWRLPVPFVWGPVGGTRPFPMQFIGQLDLGAAIRELARNAVNACQLRFDPRVRKAVRTSAAILAANRQVARDLSRAFGVSPTVQLETGVSEVRETPRSPRAVGTPLRLLWAGRLRSWKGLPLLLRGLAQLPAETQYTLRVLGEGKSQARWKRLAERLGVNQHIEWAGWPKYPEQLAHYEWADAFAFTSLRDTSGTGLLEALAAGAPIIGIDHQGAADIMTNECAMRVPATTVPAAIQGFRDAIARLANDAELLARLSEGALERARSYQWGEQWEATREIYRRASLRGASVRATSEPGDALSVVATRNVEPCRTPVGAV